MIKTAIKRLANACGYEIRRRHSTSIGNTSSLAESVFDGEDRPPAVYVRAAKPTWYANPMIFRVTHGGDTLEQEILYSHLTLFKFLREDFRSVLDIGSHAGNVSNLLRFLGKQVINCEIAPGYDATYKADYLDVRLSAPVEAIWCSQVLEHQRNVGIFLDKVFDDLVDGGLLGLTVPMQLDMDLSFGHCNLFSPMIVIYHLVLAGFDCSAIRLKVYSGDICVLLRKRHNGIKRRLSMGSLPLTDQSAPSREVLGDEIFEGMAAAFPPSLAVQHHTRWPNIAEINWR